MPYRPKDIYRGRRKFRTLLVIGLSVLAVLIVGAIVLFYALQQFLVYDQTGVSLQLPFLDREETEEAAETEPTPALQPVEVQVIYEDPDFSEVDLGGWEELSVTKAQFIPFSDAADEAKLSAALTAVSADEYTGVVLELKNTYGQLAWASHSETAVGYGTAGTMDYTEAVAALHERGLTAAAQISCLADELMATRNWPLSLQTEAGKPYRDDDGVYWLDPYNRYVRYYLADLMGELAAMGFDEIILADLRHPVREGYGSVDEETGEVIDTGFLYSVTIQTAPNPVNAVCQMALRLAESLEDAGTVVSAQIDPSSLREGGDKTGQDPEIFWRVFARLYCPTDYWNAAGDLEYAAEAMNGGDAAVRFVPVCDMLPEGFESYVLRAAALG